MIKNTFLALLFLISYVNLDAQCLPNPNAKQSWWFGYGSNVRTGSGGSVMPGDKIRIDFNGGTATLNNPTSGQGDKTMGYEGYAVANDPVTGNLLFGTDGYFVYRASDGAKATGGGIGSNVSTGDAAAIIPDPAGTEGRNYIVIGNSSTGSVGGSLIGGKYDLQTNTVSGITTFVSGTTTEGMEVIPKSTNSRESWIVVLNQNSTVTVYEYKLSGFNPTPVSTYTFPDSATPLSGESISWIPQQPDKIMMSKSKVIVLANFNRATGVISGQLTKFTGNDIKSSYGPALSPNGKYIYYADIFPGGLYKFSYYDTTTGTSINVPYSRIIYGIRIGPDGRLYFVNSSGTTNYLSYINDANTPPISASEIFDFNLGGRNSSLKLPKTYWAAKSIDAPTVSTTAATCSANGTAKVDNYNASYTYTFTPAGPSVGAGGILSGMTAGTSYTVNASNGGCQSAASNPFSIAAMLSVPQLNVTVGSSTTFCTGGSVLLTSTYNYTGAYQWYKDGILIPGAIYYQYTATASGVYTVARTLGGCTSPASTGITVTVNPIPPVLNVSAGGPTTFCTGGSVLLTSTYNTTGAYQWYKDGILIPGAIYYQYTATASGVYTVTRTLGGCTSPASTGTNVVVNLAPATPIITASKTSICKGESITLSTSVTAGSYQWYKDDILIPGAVSQTYIATQPGNYKVQIISGGCSATSANYNISNSSNCYCTKPGNFSTGGLITKIGITGKSKLVNWPEDVPNGFIALESGTKGFVITRIQNSNMIPIAQLREGMLIYDIDAACIKLYNGTTWNCIKRSCNE